MATICIIRDVCGCIHQLAGHHATRAVTHYKMHFISGDILQDPGIMATELDRDAEKLNLVSKARKPNWTDSEIHCLVDGYRQWMHILKPKSGNVAPLVERHRIWSTIADSVNSYNVGQPGCMRAIKEVQKKWENLTNRMRMELLQQKSEQGFEISHTSRIINVLVNNCDLPDTHTAPTRPVTDDMGIVKIERCEEYEDGITNDGDLGFDHFHTITGASKGSTESISSGELATDNEANDIPATFNAAENYSSRLSLIGGDDQHQMILPEHDTNNISETNVSSNDTIHTQTKSAIHDVIRERVRVFQKTNSKKNLLFNDTPTSVSSASTAVEGHTQSPPPNKLTNGLYSTGYLRKIPAKSLPLFNRRLNLTKRVNSLNPHLQFQTTRRLQEEVLQLKKRRLLSDIERIQLDKERLKLETEKLVIDKETAALAKEKMKYELEQIKRACVPQ